MDQNRNAFFALLRAGIWEQGVGVQVYEPLNFRALYRMAVSQSVVGLVSAGLEHIEDRSVTKQEVMRFMKKVLALEGRNRKICLFIEELMGRLKSAGVYALLVKGQGIAQCYERPNWRSVGDVDLLFDDDNYQKAKELLVPIATEAEAEDVDKKHLGLTIDSWLVELHGTLHNGLSGRITRVVDRIQDETFHDGLVRVWHNGNTDVLLPCVDNDIIFVFTHLLQHFFQGGVVLRQVCDWMRLLWVHRESIDLGLLKSRIEEMRLLTEWEAFAAVAVDYLGCPQEAMPFYRSSPAVQRRALRVLDVIFESGSEDESYKAEAPALKRKLITIWRQIRGSFTYLGIFPLDTLRFLCYFFVVGFRRTRKTTKL